MLDQSYYEKADEIIALYGPKSASLIPIMQDIQAEYRYLPGELLNYVADKIGVTRARAYSVATFYENFSFDAKGKYVIKVCDGTACHVRKSMPVKEALMKELGYSDGYKYSHDYPGHFVDQEFMPEGLRGRVFYEPAPNRHEDVMKSYLESCWPKYYKK